SPDWETELVDAVFRQTKLLDKSEYDCLKHLHKLRNTCSHPILKSQAIELISPNKETVISFLKNSLIGVLCKSSMMTKKIGDYILEEISSDDFKKIPYNLQLKFFSSSISDITSNELKGKVFQQIWDVSFNSKEKLAIQNKDINLKFLNH